MRGGVGCASATVGPGYSCVRRRGTRRGPQVAAFRAREEGAAGAARGVLGRLCVRVLHFISGGGGGTRSSLTSASASMPITPPPVPPPPIFLTFIQVHPEASSRGVPVAGHEMCCADKRPLVRTGVCVRVTNGIFTTPCHHLSILLLDKTKKWTRPLC